MVWRFPKQPDGAFSKIVLPEDGASARNGADAERVKMEPFGFPFQLADTFVKVVSRKLGCCI